MEVSCQLHEPAVSPLGKKLSYPLSRRLDGPHVPSVVFGGKKISCLFPASNYDSFVAHPIGLSCAELLRLRKEDTGLIPTNKHIMHKDGSFSYYEQYL